MTDNLPACLPASVRGASALERDSRGKETTYRGKLVLARRALHRQIHKG